MKLVHEVKMEVYSSPQMRRGILKRAISDLKGRGGRWTSKCDNIRGTSIIVSLKRDEIIQVSRLTGSDNFYPNVTTLRSGLCCRNSVCRLSVVCRSVTLVHPTQGVEPFAKFLHRCVRWPSSDPRAKFYGDRPRGTPPSGALNARVVSKYSDFRHIEGYNSETVQDGRIVSIKDE